jgi:protein-tyrosine phosphatase/membrane-associated phospholipid phosphatase
MTSVFLSFLFVVVYGATNWLTAQRPVSQISTWYFSWELTSIPYLPLLIVPYMSIDLFFLTAPFLCRNRKELRTFSRRVVFTILAAAGFFLLVPLRLGWPDRPRVGGWFGEFIEQSCTAPFLMEYPHNLFPAMHIALCMILADMYGRHTHGLIKFFLYAWFCLIGLSTVLTWQHHLVDVAGGMLLGSFAFYLFHELESSRAVAANVRLGCYFAVASVLVLAPAIVLWPWGVFLLWPASGLAILAAGYFGLGPGIFRKASGCLPLSTRTALGPILIGHYLSLLYYRRRCSAWNEILEGLFIGRMLSRAEATIAIQQGVTAVLDLTAEFSETRQLREIRYCNIPILDLTALTQQQLHKAVAFITEETAKGIVYVHCKIGYSRSAAVACAYLIASGQAATADEAVAWLRWVRPSIIIRPEALSALRDFARNMSRRRSHQLSSVLPIALT